MSSEAPRPWLHMNASKVQLDDVLRRLDSARLERKRSLSYRCSSDLMANFVVGELKSRGYRARRSLDDTKGIVVRL